MLRHEIQKKHLDKLDTNIKTICPVYNLSEDNSDNEKIQEKIEIALNNKIPPQLNTKIKRKQNGIFNTEKRITSYIIESTLGKLYTEKKSELGL